MQASSSTITESITKLLSHLVAFPTITADQATNRAALDWIAECLNGLPLHIKRHESHGYPSLVATTKPTKHPRLWLAAHLDVVPGPPRSFKPMVRSGRLYGRGVHDMKAAIAVFLTLLHEYGPKLADLDLGLMITCDEEIGGYNGVKYLLDQGYRGQAVLLPDSGAGWEMEVGSKGVSWWELTATGVTSHASRPWNGLNAIDQIVGFVNHVRAHLPSEPCGDPKHQHTTLNFATMTAGTVANQVPDQAVARVDVRIAPGQDLQTVMEWFNDAMVAYPSVEAKSLLADPPYRVRDEAPLELFRNLAASLRGRFIVPTVAHGSSDARHFAVHHIPTVNVSPTGSGFHVPQEWVDLDDLEAYYEITRHFIHNWVK